MKRKPFRSLLILMFSYAAILGLLVYLIKVFL